MQQNKEQKIVLTYSLILLVYWVVLRISELHTSIWNYLFSLLFSMTPFVGGLYAVFYLTKKWGGIKSHIGKAITCLGLGLFSWGSGSVIWAYYNIFLMKEIPYPSEADVGYVLALPLWFLSMYFLSKAIGTKFGMRSGARLVIILVVALVSIFGSYQLLVNVAREGYITTVDSGISTMFFDLAYPIGDIIILVMVFSYFGLSYNYLGGVYKQFVYFIFLGFFFMYLADFIFSYTTTKGTFYVGHWGDLFFLVALALMTYGLLGFKQEASVAEKNLEKN